MQQCAPPSRAADGWPGEVTTMQTAQTALLPLWDAVRLPSSILTLVRVLNRYLRGVPFGWPLRLWRPWTVALSVLAAVFFVLDSLNMRREDAAGCGNGPLARSTAVSSPKT